MNNSAWLRHKDVSRRQFLTWGGLGLAGIGLSAYTAGLWAVPVAQGATPVVTGTPTPMAMDASMPGMASTATLAPLPPNGLEIELTAKPDTVAVLPGTPTQVYRYEGRVIQGDPAALQVIPDSYVGPIVRAHKGQWVRVHLHNQLPVESNIHWHGLIVPSNMDGHPHDLAAPGGEFVYDFEMLNRAGTYWFHPHKHGETGAQVNKGLAALFIVSDDEEQQVGLPSGNQDVALVIQDRRFDADNQFVYLTGAMAGMGSQTAGGTAMNGQAMGGQAMGGGMMDSMMGFLGDHILVNGKPNAVLPLATRAYRMRVLNGSNARIYKLAWSDGRPMTVLGTEGGLLAQPAGADPQAAAPQFAFGLLLPHGPLYRQAAPQAKITMR